MCSAFYSGLASVKQWRSVWMTSDPPITESCLDSLHFRLETLFFLSVSCWCCWRTLAPSWVWGFDVSKRGRVDKEASLKCSERQPGGHGPSWETEALTIRQHLQELKEQSVQAVAMEPIAQIVEAADAHFQRRGLRFVAKRGASSQFVGSTIMILSTYAVTTLTMNCGKNIQERRLRPNGN